MPSSHTNHKSHTAILPIDSWIFDNWIGLFLNQQLVFNWARIPRVNFAINYYCPNPIFLFRRFFF